MKNISKIIDAAKLKDRPKNINHEFQFYGCYLAESLDDTKRYSLYIKLAKNLPRALLEEALNYTKGYYNAKNKGKVFMWRLKQLRENIERELS